MTTQVITTQLIVDASGAKQGVAEFEASMKRAKDAAVRDSNATASSFDAAQRKWTQSLAATDPVIKAQIAMERDLARQRQVNSDAVKLGIATQVAAEAQLERVRQKHIALIRDIQGHSKATEELRSRALSLTGNLGATGTALIALGPAGLAAGAGLAVVTLGLSQATKAANDLADKAGKMVDFAETTGLTTTQLQALQKAGAFVGVEAEKIGTGFERFSVSLEELRRGTGNLYEGLNRISPTLTRQLALTRDAGEAWDVLSAAIAKATDQEQKNAIARAAFGRTGVPFTRLAGASTEAGGLKGLQADLGAVNTLTEKQLKTWDELKDKIDYTTKIAKQNIAAIFTEDVLRSQLTFTNGLLTISQAARNFSVSGDWNRFISDLNSSGLQKFLIAASTLPGVGALAGAARLATMGKVTTPDQTPASFADRFNASAGSLKADDPGRLDKFNAANLQRQIAAMGEAASSADRLRLAEMQLGIAAKEAGLSQEQFNVALEALRIADKISDLRDMVSALGSAATVTEQYNLKLSVLGQLLHNNRISQETYNRAVDGLNQDFNLQRDRDRISALGDAATETDRYALRVAELRRQLDQGRISQEVFNQAVLAANPILKDVRETAAGFTQDFVRGLMAGKSAMESLGRAATNLSNKLADRAIMSLFSGDFIGAAVAGAGAIVSGVFGANQQKNEQKRRQAEEQMQAIADADMRAQMAGIDKSSREGNLTAMLIQQEQERMQALQKGLGALAALENAHRAELAALNKEWDAREREALVRKREEEQRLFDESIAAIKGRGANFEERLYAAFADTSTLSGALAEFERKARQERENEIKNGGEALAVLEITLAAERLQIQKRFNEQTLAEQKRSQEQQHAALNRAAINITNYLLGLRTGSESPLSPTARFRTAQTAFQGSLGLAQGGNIDALDRITQDAETFRKAAQDLYGSSEGYQAIFQQISDDLTALSAVQNSTDPVVRTLNQIADRQETAFFDAMTSSTQESSEAAFTQINLQTQMVEALRGLNESMVEANKKQQQKQVNDAAALYAAAQSKAGSASAAYNSAVAAWQSASQVRARGEIEGWIHPSTPYPTASQYGVPQAQAAVQAAAAAAAQALADYQALKTLYGLAKGGRVAFAPGGRVAGPGGPTSDSIPAWLSNGEGVVNATAMRALDSISPRLFDDFLMKGRLPVVAAASGSSAMVAEIRSMHRTLSAALSRIASLEEYGNRNIKETTRALAEQTRELAREERIAIRKRAA